MSAQGRGGFVAVVAAVALVANACTGADATRPFRPTFASTPCPTDITAVVVVPVSCGYLTVLEDRAGGSGRTIRLFVTNLEPAGGNLAPDPVAIIDDTIGSWPEYGGLTPRTDREEYIIDGRGSGHSEPSLACPEVQQLAASLLEVPISDAGARTDFTDAVTTCRDRLAGEDIDLSAYTIDAMAADVEDLRRALGIDRWNLQSWSSGSRVMLEVMRDFPEHIRTSVLISPEFPQSDPIVEGITGTKYAVAQLAAACEAQETCGRRFPEIGRALSEAIDQLDADPVTLIERDSLAAAAAGHPVHILVDGGMLLRIVRAALAFEGGASIGLLPRMLYTILDGHVPANILTVAGSIPSASSMCLGLNWICRPRGSEGTFYSALCHDELPFVDRDALASVAAGNPAAQEDFEGSPYFDVCAAWNVGHADPSAGQPVTTDIPTLLLAGQFDPFSSVPEIQAAAGTFSNGHVVVVPRQSTNPNGSLECPRSIRNAWWEDPTTRPDTGCFAQIPPIVFA